jgi:hypothetical protein
MSIPEHNDLEWLEYECDELGVDLSCFFEYEPEQVGSREFGTGLKMYLPGSSVDISPIISVGLLNEIEEYAQEVFPKRWQENRDADLESVAYDRWLDRQ